MSIILLLQFVTLKETCTEGNTWVPWFAGCQHFEWLRSDKCADIHIHICTLSVTQKVLNTESQHDSRQLVNFKMQGHQWSPTDGGLSKAFINSLYFFLSSFSHYDYPQSVAPY